MKQRVIPRFNLREGFQVLLQQVQTAFIHHSYVNELSAYIQTYEQQSKKEAEIGWTLQHCFSAYHHMMALALMRLCDTHGDSLNINKLNCLKMKSLN